MQAASCTCPAQHQAARAVLIFRLLLDDLPVAQGFRHLFFPDLSLNAALHGMLSPVVHASPDLFYDRLDIHPGLVAPLMPLQ